MKILELFGKDLAAIEKIRKQRKSYCKPVVSDRDLQAFRSYLDTLYSNRPQLDFAYKIYMKA